VGVRGRAYLLKRGFKPGGTGFIWVLEREGKWNLLFYREPVDGG